MFDAEDYFAVVVATAVLVGKVLPGLGINPEIMGLSRDHEEDRIESYEKRDDDTGQSSIAHITVICCSADHSK